MDTEHRKSDLDQFDYFIGLFIATQRQLFPAILQKFPGLE